jgi:4-amino-4-deoxy-L-arabinose transferase-like glycosyltransferase
MMNRFSRVYPQRWSQIVLLAGFCLIFFFVNLNQWDLWNPDEPRYAEVAREMVNGGDWVLMHNNGNMYTDKPPLFFWMVAFSSFLTGGFTSFSARFPSAFFGTLTVLLTFLLGKRTYSSRTGLLAGLILATAGEFTYLSTRANIDATLALFTTASLFCFWEWNRSRTEGGGTELNRGRKRWIYGFYAAMSFATMTKGPVGFVLPLLVAVVFLLSHRDWKSRLKGIRLVSGLALMMGLVLCWYLPAVLKGGREYLDATLFKHSIDRFSTGWSHVKPFYYYLINFPLGFLPWVIFLPGAVVYGFSRELIGKKREFLFLLTWFVVIFVFFSISKGKRSLYLLPLYPAAAVMVGKLVEDIISHQMERFRREWIRYPLYVLIGLLAAGGPVLLWIVSKQFPLFLSSSVPLAVLLTGGGVALFFLNRSHRHGPVFFLIVAIVASGFFYTQRVIFPLVNPLKSARFISQEVTSRMKPGDKVAVYGGFGTGPYNFYTGVVPIIEVEKKGQLSALMNSPDRVFCFIKHRDYASLVRSEGEASLKQVGRQNVGGDDIVLISNR